MSIHFLLTFHPNPSLTYNLDDTSMLNVSVNLMYDLNFFISFESFVIVCHVNSV